jgi:catechol 2,3-dioxygenase-like lactoylglutathione lyase family enzyme
MKLHRVILPVRNIEKAVEFYQPLFDMKGVRVSPGRHYFNLGGTILACYDPVTDEDDAAPD